jgi:hypothetical protein
MLAKHRVPRNILRWSQLIPHIKPLAIIGIHRLLEKPLLTPNVDRMQLPMCRALSSTAGYIQDQMHLLESYHLGSSGVQPKRTRSSDLTTLGKPWRTCPEIVFGTFVGEQDAAVGG